MVAFFHARADIHFFNNWYLSPLTIVFSIIVNIILTNKDIVLLFWEDMTRIETDSDFDDALRARDKNGYTDAGYPNFSIASVSVLTMQARTVILCGCYYVQNVCKLSTIV
jgi:hypothetical protein